MAERYEASFPADGHAPGDARRFVVRAVGDVAPFAPPMTVSIVVSEMVTNAVRAAASRIDVAVIADEQELRIVIADDAPGMPTLRKATDEDTTGRGLPLVGALCNDWGVEPLVTGGKRVWARILAPVRPHANA